MGGSQRLGFSSWQDLCIDLGYMVLETKSGAVLREFFYSACPSMPKNGAFGPGEFHGQYYCQAGQCKRGRGSDCFNKTGVASSLTSFPLLQDRRSQQSNCAAGRSPSIFLCSRQKTASLTLHQVTELLGELQLQHFSLYS